MKIPLLSAGSEILNESLNKALNVFNSFFTTTYFGAFDPDEPDQKYIVDEVIIPCYTDDERIALANPVEGEMVINTTYNTLNIFINGKWQKIESSLLDTIYTITVLDNVTTDPIEGALVTIAQASILTNASGVALVPVLPFAYIGTAPITVSKSGYTTYSSTFSYPTPTSFTVNLS